VTGLFHRLRPLFHVALPVAVASSLVCLAVINMALVKGWKGEPEDGVLWKQSGVNVVAAQVDERGAGRRSGVHAGDVLVAINGQEVSKVAEVLSALEGSEDGRILRYSLVRAGATDAATTDVQLQPMPLARTGLYYSIALVGILAIGIGTSVRLRRPNDPATLHFFWLTVSFFGVLSFTPSTTTSTTSSNGRIWWRGSPCRRCSCTSHSSFRSGWIRGSRPAPAESCCRCATCRPS
jgi:membrane-associated protease RseP (regulator of RpoE activity)